MKFDSKLDEINQLFLPNMRNKLLWFYQEVDEPEPAPSQDLNKPGPSRAGVSTVSKTPQGKFRWAILEYIQFAHSNIFIHPQV